MSEARAPESDRSSSLVIVGWIVTALTLIFPPLVIGAVGIGIALWQRKHGHGPAMVAVALLALIVSIYLASQTLIPRD